MLVKVTLKNCFTFLNSQTFLKCATRVCWYDDRPRAKELPWRLLQLPLKKRTKLPLFYITFCVIDTILQFTYL